MDPEDAVSYNNKGIVEEKLGYKERSKKSFDKADKLVGYQPKEYKSTNAPKENPVKKTPDQIPEQLKNQPTPQTKSLSFTNYWKTVGKVLSDKNTRAEFFSFIQSKLGKKK